MYSPTCCPDQLTQMFKAWIIQLSFSGSLGTSHTNLSTWLGIKEKVKNEVVREIYFLVFVWLSLLGLLTAAVQIGRI